MLPRLQRFDSPVDAMIEVLEGFQAGLWTALPGIVNSFDPITQTVTVQTTIQMRQTAPDDSKTWVNVPLLLDVPVQFSSGGGYTLTFPLAVGDEGLVVFASRCIDAWWQLGGIKPQAELRLHDLSDGFFIPGVKSKPNVIPNISTTAVQLRTDTGATYIEIAPGGKVRIEAATIEVHARNHYQWDVNGYGEGVTYLGGNVWNVHKWQTPTGGQVVTNTNTNINPPEGP